MANDKIAELIKEATALAWIDRVANGPVPIYAEEHMVKLAELIVQECISMADKESERYSKLDHEYWYCSMAMDNYRELVRKHFGVEE